MTEMRKDRRAPASLKVKYKSATVDDFIEQFGTDVSRGGIFIKTKKPLEAGALLKFEFQLQDGSAVLHGVGRVAWRRLEQQARPDLPAGMGIKFFKLSDHSRVVVERIESRFTGNKSRYEQNDNAELAPPLSGPPPAADSGAKQLPGNGRRGMSGGSGPLTLPPPPAVSSIPPALADVPSRQPAGRIVSRPAGGPLPKGTVGSFFPERVDKGPRKSSGSPASRTRDASEFLASAFQAGAGPDVRDRAREQAERARRDPESVDLARELFGDLGGDATAAAPVSQPATGGTLAGGIAAPSGGPERLASPAPEAIAVSTPVPAVELPRSAASRSSNPSFADKIPSIEQLVDEAGREPAGASQRSGARESLRAPSFQPAGSQPAAARKSSGAPEHQPLTLAISVPSASGGATAAEAPGRSRLLLFAALATTLTLGAVAVYVGMQRGAFGGAAPQAAVDPTPEPTPPSAAAEPSPPAAEPTPPTAAAEHPAPAAPAPVAGPPVPVALQSKPRGAEVLVDGKTQGVTPLTLKLPSNVPVEISVKRMGYATVTRSITPVEKLPPEMFELAPLSYHIVVTEPVGATVSAFTKRSVSPEPLDVGHIESSVTISIEKEGFVRASRALKIDEFQERDGVMRAEITQTLAPLAAARRRAPRPAEPAQPPTDAPPSPSEEPEQAAPPVMQVTPQAEAPADPAPEPAAPEPKPEATPEPPPPAPEGN